MNGGNVCVIYIVVLSVSASKMFFKKFRCVYLSIYISLRANGMLIC
jgi:hypothetical protein